MRRTPNESSLASELTTGRSSAKRLGSDHAVEWITVRTNKSTGA